MEKKRLVWLDIAKALTVFLVILGHVVRVGNVWFQLIFAFHMPAFILFSGYTLSLKGRSFGGFVKKKAKDLLVPYLAFLVVGFLITLLLTCEHYSAAVFRDPANVRYYLRYAFYYTQPEHAHVGATWFLMGLFWGSVLAYPVITLMEKFGPWAQISGLIVLVLLGAYGVTAVTVPGFGRLPWKLDSAVMFTVFLVIGFYARKYRVAEWLDRGGVWADLTCLAAGLLLVWFFGMRVNGYVNIADCIYANPFAYLGAALSGTAAMVGAARLIARCGGRVVSYLAGIGTRTLLIFALQAYAYQQINYCFNRIFGTAYVIGAVDSLPYALLVSVLALFVLDGVARLWEKRPRMQHRQTNGGGTKL